MSLPKGYLMARFTFERVVGGLLSYAVDTSSKSLYRAALVKELACAWSSHSQAKRELMTDYRTLGLPPQSRQLNRQCWYISLGRRM
jgi:hypothetical protein